jgi:hypothetical protein
MTTPPKYHSNTKPFPIKYQTQYRKVPWYPHAASAESFSSSWSPPSSYSSHSWLTGDRSAPQ